MCIESDMRKEDLVKNYEGPRTQTHGKEVEILEKNCPNFSTSGKVCNIFKMKCSWKIAKDIKTY